MNNMNVNYRQRASKMNTMLIHVTMTPYQYAMANLGAALMGKTLDCAIGSIVLVTPKEPTTPETTNQNDHA